MYADFVGLAFDQIYNKWEMALYARRSNDNACYVATTNGNY